MISWQFGTAQLTLEKCHEKAIENYPMIRQYDLLSNAASYNISNATKGYLPQLVITGKATYQSDVITIPVKIPNFEFDKVSQDQYQLNAEVNQLIWDGGLISNQKKVIDANSEVDKSKIEVELYSLKDRINQLFFGILLLEENLKRNESLEKELRTNLDKVTALRDNGVVTNSDVDAINVEIINVKQKRIELQSNLISFRKMLSILIADSISDDEILSKPENVIQLNAENKRPELRLFEAQENYINSQFESINTMTRPKIGLFFQGGYGRPGFNLLKNEFQFYYIGGIRFSWNLSSFYNSSNNEELLLINKASIGVQRETFLYNNDVKREQQRIEVEKWKELIKNDDEIIRLRTNIKKTAEVRVENGTMSVNDLIREINAENFAKLDKAMHEIQLLLAIYNYKFLVND